MRKKTVVIVGRPNVGKSTLFNRLTGDNKAAITSSIAGTTRDRHYGICRWNGVEFIVIDTGGYVATHKNENFIQEINSQITLAINEADVILFLVDCHSGLTDQDRFFARELHRKNKNVILVANKSDNDKYAPIAYEFMRLGFGEAIHICANSGSGTGDLLDMLLEKYISKNSQIIRDTDKDDDDSINEDNAEDDGEMNKNIEDINENTEDGGGRIFLRKTKGNSLPKIAIIGKPNVGKSSLLNVLLGEDKMIVSSIAGTTRDAIDSVYNRFGKKFILIDTAGIRRKAAKKDDIEFYSSLRSIHALEDCDVCLYIIDAIQGICNQDMSLLNLAIRNKKGVVVLVNKMDLFQRNEKRIKELKESLSRKMKNLKFIPVLYTSVVEKKNIFQAIEKVMEVYENKNQIILTSQLNDVMLPIIKQQPPQSIRGKEIKIKYLSSLPTRDINIAFFCNRSKDINEQYKRFLEAKLRENFNLCGVPIGLVFKGK